MLRKFFEGLVFGAGFAIAFFVVWYSAALLPTMFAGSRLSKLDAHAVQEPAGSSSATSTSVTAFEPGKPFHELGVDEQIAQSSAIALARYEQAPDGQRKAIIREFLKKDAEVYYNVGDEYVPGSHYASPNADFGDGLVIFFAGSPPMMRMSMSYSGDRIRGLGDIPLALFRDKCQKPDHAAK